MIAISLAALLCGFCTVYLILPIAQNKRWVYALMLGVPVFSLGLYLLLGAPVF